MSTAIPKAAIRTARKRMTQVGADFAVAYAMDPYPEYSGNALEIAHDAENAVVVADTARRYGVDRRALWECCITWDLAEERRYYGIRTRDTSAAWIFGGDTV